MFYRVTCRSLSGEIRQTDDFRSEERAERWANAINRVGYWYATIEVIGDDVDATSAYYTNEDANENESN
jgi:hypothetical protein